MDLTCPKCQGQMRSYERNGVTIDQCGECRGVFLDRGELDRLIDQEGSFYEQRRPEGERPEQRWPDKPRRDRDDDDDDYRRREHQGGFGFGHGHGYGKKRKRESFLSELFD